MAKQPATPRHAADDAASDAQTFRAAVRDVTPLAQTPLAAGLAKPQPRARRRRAALSETESLDAAMPLIATLSADESAAMGAIAGIGVGMAGIPDDTVTPAGALSFQRAGVRTQVVRRLRRGRYPSDVELDLHGLSQAAAREQLAQFLERSRDSGYRCVRIIHGKGYRSGARGPVLKTAVNLWLRRHTDVMAFVSARPIDGGTGAVYVLLRA